MIRIGTVLYGYCGGLFGRDSYGRKRVEAIGHDWVVVRDERDTVDFFTGNPEDLEIYSTEAAQKEWENN